MNNSNIITSVLHLKEASDLLINDEPEISYALLEVAKAILDNNKITDDLLSSAITLADEIIDTNISTENN